MVSFPQDRTRALPTGPQAISLRPKSHKFVQPGAESLVLPAPWLSPFSIVFVGFGELGSGPLTITTVGDLLAAGTLEIVAAQAREAALEGVGLLVISQATAATAGLSGYGSTDATLAAGAAAPFTAEGALFTDVSLAALAQLVGEGVTAFQAQIPIGTPLVGAGVLDILAGLPVSALFVGDGSGTADALMGTTPTLAGSGVLANSASVSTNGTGEGGGSGNAKHAHTWSGSKGATVLSHATWTDLFTFTAYNSGSATVSFSVSHSWGSNFLHWASEDRGIRILVDGAQVASQMQSYTTGSWSTTLNQSGVTVPGGATVQIQGYGETTTYSACRTVTISSASMSISGVS